MRKMILNGSILSVVVLVYMLSAIPLGAQVEIFTSRDEWEAVVGPVRCETFDAEELPPFGTSPTPFTTAEGTLLEAIRPPEVTIQYIDPGLVNGTGELHFRDFTSGVRVTPTAGGIAVGFDYDTAIEPWTVDVNAATTTLPSFSGGFIGFVDPSSISFLDLTGAAGAQGGISIDNLCWSGASEVGAICGTKFHDANSNRIWDMPNEPGLAAWQIVLTDSAGNTQIATTDADGVYCFTGLFAGVYTLTEIAQPGWVQTAPSSGAHTVVLSAGEMAVDVDFGNDCCRGAPAGDLDLNLNTGWDQVASSTTAAGNPDDDWRVTLDANGGATPRAADVVLRTGGWSAPVPDSMWVTAVVSPSNPSRPGFPQLGFYDYTYCFCLAPGFSDPALTVGIRADDRVDSITLNRRSIFNGPGGGFNGPLLEVEESRRRFFRVGRNCLTVRVEDTAQSITGLNLVGRMTASGGACCPGRGRLPGGLPPGQDR